MSDPKDYDDEETKFVETFDGLRLETGGMDSAVPLSSNRRLYSAAARNRKVWTQLA